MLVWIDLETTGLDASKERILEVACIITDDALNEVARFERVTDEAQRTDFSKVNSYVIEMHFTNGLWRESLLAKKSENKLDMVDRALASFIWEHGCIKKLNANGEVDLVSVVNPQLAGSTISFDRAFLAKHLHRSHDVLHYRNVDVSSFNEVAKRVWPAVYEGRPRDSAGATHRAMSDINDSLRVMRYYIEKLGPV